MADEVAKLVVQVDPSQLKAEMNKLAQQGLTVSFKQGGKLGPGGKESAIVQASGTAAAVESVYKNLPAGTKAMMAAPATSQLPQTSWFGNLKNTFSEKNLKAANKSLFMMQMASLGVAFSFQSVINSALGLFSGLSDLGAMLSGGAMGTAFAGIATGGENTTDIAKTMGVTPEMSTEAWVGFTAIVNQFKAVFDSFADKVLSPEMIGGILAVIDALATELAKPEVVKAVQELIKSILDLALAIIPLLPVIADFINWLGDTGLLELFISLIFAAQILLPLLAYFQFIFQAIVLLTGVLEVLGVGLGAFFFWVAIILVAIDFLIHLFENLANGMDPLDAVLTALGQTVADVVNIIISAINPILGFLGMAKIEKMSTASGHEPATTTQAKTVVNNITFAKSVNTGDKKAAATMGTQVANATYG